MDKNPNVKMIRFIDSRSNHLFSIPDGGTIIITHKDGEKLERTCEYLDDLHTKIGDFVYHVCQLAELMERAGAKYEPKLEDNKYPAYCYSTNQASGEMIIIHRGETGFYRCNYSTPDRQRNREIVDELNSHVGISRGMEESMRGGSMFGWDKPIANPENYEEDGTMRKSNPYDRTFAERMKQNYPVGTKLVLDQLYDPYCDLPIGLKGIVQHVDDIGTVHCIFENGSTLGLIPGEDRFHKDVEKMAENLPEEAEEYGEERVIHEQGL